MRSMITLPAQPTSAHDAREFVHDTLDKWQSTSAVDEAELVVTELVANASRGPNPSPSLTVTVTMNASGTWIDVADGDAQRSVPRIVATQHAFESGTALVVIDSLADSWGVVPTDSGKHVWVRLADARHLHEKELARRIVTEQVHRVAHDDCRHVIPASDEIANSGTEQLRHVVEELASLASQLVCLCSLYEDTDTVEFWDGQLDRMHTADDISTVTVSHRTLPRVHRTVTAAPKAVTAAPRELVAD